MKAVVQVLLPPDTTDLDAAVRSALEPYRLDEDDLTSIRGYHWDYWIYADSQLGDRELAERFAGAPAELLASAARVDRFSTDRLPSAVLTPDGRWHDIGEFGWRLLRGDSRANRAAWGEWQKHVLRLWGDHPAAIGVEVLYHC